MARLRAVILADNICCSNERGGAWGAPAGPACRRPPLSQVLLLTVKCTTLPHGTAALRKLGTRTDLATGKQCLMTKVFNQSL